MAKLAEATETPKKKYRMVEIVVDENLTKIRRLVPADTDEDDIPENAEMYSVEETEMMLRRQSRPVPLLRGHQVRLRPDPANPTMDNPVMGTIDGKMKSGKLRVKWDNGTVSRHESGELERVY
jgi:hypothetical protein